jgi:hypothetical protein
VRDHHGRVRRWKRHIAEPGASSRACTDSDADSNTDADPNTDADADADPNTDANPERWNNDHHHVRGRVTQDADRAAGNARHVREQRHAGA